MDHFGECAVEELLWATQGSLWPVCCGRTKLGYSGITLGSVLWKSYFGLLRDHFGQCAVEELLWAAQGGSLHSGVYFGSPCGLKLYLERPLFVCSCNKNQCVIMGQ